MLMQALYWVLWLVLALAGVIDARQRIVPHTLVLGLLVAGIWTGTSWAAFLLMVPCAWFLWRLGWCSPGDSKLLIGLAAASGWWAWELLFILVLIRDVYRGLWVLVACRPKDFQTFWGQLHTCPVPFVPAFFVAWGVVPLGLAAHLLPF
jgi:Flp pilus assembly protein protease CpaA